ncbi:fec operon regulator FecR [compost metagenome]
MAEPTTLEQIREQAALWLVRLEDAPSPEALAEFTAWHDADARHAQLFEQLQQLWQAVSPQPKAKPRRTGKIGLALALPVAIAVGQFLPVQDWLLPPPESVATTRSRLVFHDRPLPEVLAELDQQRPGYIWASNEQLQALRFTGVLPQDSDAALALLQAALPIRVETHGKYLVQVRPR